MSEALRAGCCRRHRHRAVLRGNGWKWVLAIIANYHDPAWYQHHFNVAYGFYDRGWLNDHDLPRLRPQHCRRHDDHDDGGADINDDFRAAIHKLKRESDQHIVDDIFHANHILKFLNHDHGGDDIDIDQQHDDITQHDIDEPE